MRQQRELRNYDILFSDTTFLTVIKHLDRIFPARKKKTPIVKSPIVKEADVS